MGVGICAEEEERGQKEPASERDERHGHRVVVNNSELYLPRW